MSYDMTRSQTSDGDAKTTDLVVDLQCVESRGGSLLDSPFVKGRRHGSYNREEGSHHG